MVNNYNKISSSKIKHKIQLLSLDQSTTYECRVEMKGSAVMEQDKTAVSFGRQYCGIAFYFIRDESDASEPSLICRSVMVAVAVSLPPAIVRIVSVVTLPSIITITKTLIPIWLSTVRCVSPVIIIVVIRVCGVVRH